VHARCERPNRSILVSGHRGRLWWPEGSRPEDVADGDRGRSLVEQPSGKRVDGVCSRLTDLRRVIAEIAGAEVKVELLGTAFAEARLPARTGG
jgi:hypothetical protein